MDKEGHHGLFTSTCAHIRLNAILLRVLTASNVFSCTGDHHHLRGRICSLWHPLPKIDAPKTHQGTAQKRLRNHGSQTTNLHRNRTKKKSAHTALAVKACLLGGNSNTKFSITFVGIADSSRYISFSWRGAKNDFAPRPQFLHQVQRLVVLGVSA